jgi:hypothetical protein
MNSLKLAQGLLTLAALALSLPVPAAGGNIPRGTPVIRGAQKISVPAWAYRERELLDLNGKLVDLAAKAYMLPNGYLNCTYGADKGVFPHRVATTMYKWPLVYALGGDEIVKNRWWKIWRGGIKQQSESGFVTNEFVTCYDSNHMGQHYEGFFLAGLALRDDPDYRRLTLKYASLCDGTSSPVQNYDAKHKTMKALMAGGGGAFTRTDQFKSKNIAYWDLDQDYSYEGPSNLIYTCHLTNAFLLTGEERYRRTALDYIDAWRNRCVKNGGIMPTKVNLDGTIPKDWWGGALGWNKETAGFGGLLVTISGPNAGWANGLLLSGNISYYDAYRQFADKLWAHRYVDREGRVLTVPGWCDAAGFYADIWNGLPHNGIYASVLANIYAATMKSEDLGRVTSREMAFGPTGYTEWWEGGYETDWFKFLSGQSPEWPAQVLDDRIQRTTDDITRIEKAAAIGPTPENTGIPDGGWCGPLVNLMTGAVMPRWQGQLLLARFFYFDPERRRPGIPQDCAALVESLSDKSATLFLVNTSKTEKHTVLVQTGAYAEHQCIAVTSGNNRSVPVDGTLFAVELPPSSGLRLAVKMKRYANTPQLSLPW